MFWKLFGSYGLLIVASIGILGMLVSNRVADELRDDLEMNLKSQNQLVRDPLENLLDNPKVAAGADLVNHFASLTSTRITVTDADGKVLEDSEADPRTMENHIGRPEFVQAQTDRFGTITRTSATVKRPFMYLVQRIDRDGKTIGYIRLALPMVTVNSRLAGLRWLMFVVTTGTGVIAMVIALILAKRFSSRLTRLAEHVQSPETYLSRADIESKDEIGSLARCFHRIQKELLEQMADTERIRKDLQVMLETLPEGVIAIDGAQQIRFANPSVFSLFRLPKQNISGRPLHEIIREPALQESIASTFAEDEPFATEFELTNPLRVVAFRGRKLMMESGPGIIIVLQDITELRRLEGVRQEFFTNVSHELKTPLAAIKAFTETLLDGGIENQDIQVRFLQRIDEQANRLHMLVIDMLMLARAESRDPGFDIQPLNVGSAVLGCVESLRDKAEAKRHTLRAEVAHRDCWVEADSEGILTILRNLIDNAIKYTPEGGAIVVSVERTDESVVLSVEDNGVGIPKADLDRVFERFYRVDKARSRELGGTGLGLSIVKHLAQTFGGSVSVTSEVDVGTRFSVVLPIATPALEDNESLLDEEDNIGEEDSTTRSVGVNP